MISQSNLEKYSNEWRDILYTLYWIEGLNMEEIAEHLDCSRGYISSQFKKLGLPVRKGKRNSIEWNKDVLYQLYWLDGLTQNEIAKMYNVSPHTIRDQFKKLNIPTIAKERIKNAEKINQLSKEELYKLYWVDGLSTCSIANKYGVSQDTVSRRFRKLNIPIRRPFGVDMYEELHDLYWNQRFSLREIGEKYGVSVTAVRRALKDNNIPTRDLSSSFFNIRDKKMLQIRVDEELIELIDGLLLGDGCISSYRNHNSNYFLSVNQRYDRIEWLKNIKERFERKGIKCNIYNNKKDNTQCYFSNFKTGFHSCKPTIHLATEYLPLFTKERVRWYPDGKKVIPEDVRLTPLSLAMWYFGDGSYCKHNKSVGFSTDGFGKEDILYLKDSLQNKYGLKSYLKTRRDNSYALEISIKDSKKFLDLIKPYYLSCFDYKFIKKEVEEDEIVCKR